MEANGEAENEFNDKLLSATRQADANLLENHLSAVSNPNIYLNRVYDEASKQKCTLLMIACLNGHEEIIRMILRRFKPDLEVPNNILLDEEHLSNEMFFDVSVLWVAAVTNNFQIVKLLVEHGANVNHTTKTNSTPIRGACYNGNVDMARYLIENGADIHTNNKNNETNLMVSANYNHIHMVTYLIDEFSWDVNVCDNDGRSVLYDAVHCASLEIVELLLKHGARNFRASIDQMSPLMWAAEKRRPDLFDAISSRCSLLEQIEAEELLGSAFVCAQNNENDLEQAFQHFSRALELRSIHDLPKVLRSVTIEIFDNRQECQTLDELEEIRYNFSNMCTEALLVRERVLGPTNEKYRDSLSYLGALLADMEQHHKALMLWMYELRLLQQYSISFDSKTLRLIVSLISEILLHSMSIPIDASLTLLALISEELNHNTEQFDYNLYTLLFLITIITEPSVVICETDRQTFYHHLLRINQRQYKTLDNRLSLLHLSLDNHTVVDDYHIKSICKYPCLQTARVLLQCGANVNANDAMRNTPLHLFVSNNDSLCDESILKLLCDADAHLDYVNALGETPFDLATNSIIKKQLKSQMYLSLKCLCARLIQKNNLPFHGKFSTSLVNFVEKH